MKSPYMTIKELREDVSKYDPQKCNNDEKKLRIEQERLLRFLEDESCSYSSYDIIKKVRPDFVLMGERRVGIEVLELTTEKEKVLERIAFEDAIIGKTIDQVRKTAFEKHGEKAKSYNYYDIGSSVSIGTGLIDIDKNKEHFSCQIKKKYEKYQDIITEFDEFIILCDARNRIEITSNHDMNDVVQMITQVQGVCIVIIWGDSRSFLLSYYSL